MASAESGSHKYHREKEDLQEEKRAENALFAKDYEVKSKSRSEGISLNDLIQLHSPNRHGYVRYIGEIPNLNQNCDFFGIELTGKYKKMGKHDGTFRGIKFFTAADKSGVFCKRHKIKKVLKHAAIAAIKGPLKKLRQTDQKKLLVFARTVRALTGLLAANSDGLNASFETARSMTSFTGENAPFLLSLENQGKDVSGGTGGLMSMSYSYSDSSTDEPSQVPTDSTDVMTMTPIDENKKIVKFAGISTWQDSGQKPEPLKGMLATGGNESSEFRKITIRNDTIGKILNTTMSTEQSADLKVELEEDFALYAVSQEARESLKSKQDVKELITNLQICINVLKKHIPKVTKMLDVNDKENTIYMTNVIQDLLKRAQNEKLSKKILTDFSGIKTMD